MERALSDTVVDCRLQLVSRLGTEVLGRFEPTAGTVAWDSTARRGKLDVDIRTAPGPIHARHPLAPYGQVLEAWWAYPRLGLYIPAGFWRIDSPTLTEPGLWSVVADPEPLARLDLMRRWQPGSAALDGTAKSQLAALSRETAVPIAMSAVRDATIPVTEWASGDPALRPTEAIVAQIQATLRPRRRDHGIDVIPLVTADKTPDWHWDAGADCVITGSPATEPQPNRVTVWYEEQIKGKDGGDDTTRLVGVSEAVLAGSRRWDGPYGRLPEVIKLDGPATEQQMRTQALDRLAQRSTTSTVKIQVRADPRIEVGDTASVVDRVGQTDCVARVTSVSLDASTGLASVDAVALSGVVSGFSVEVVA